MYSTRSVENIAEEATKHIHTNDVILTLGQSATVEAFLLKAAESVEFEVIICECAPFDHVRVVQIILISHLK